MEEDRDIGADLVAPTDPGKMAVAVREVAEIRAAMILAREQPRDEDLAYAKMARSCSRFAFAEKAAYAFPRGGTTVSGPSIRLAREAARLWGNIRYVPVQIVEIDDEWVHIRSSASDLETNTQVAAEDKFRRLVQRKVKRDDGTKETAWVKPDERDLRELINRRGATLVRNCLLQLLPPDLIDGALKAAKATCTAQAQGDMAKDPDEVRRAIIAAFMPYGITKADIIAFLGHPIEQMTAEDLANLRQNYRAIEEGEKAPWEVFPSRAEQQQTGAAELREKVAAAQKDEGDQRPEAEKVAAAQAVDFDGMTKAKLAGVVTALEEKAGVETVKLMRDSVGVEDPAKLSKEALAVYAKALSDAAGQQGGLF